jgi:hypothetical protein
MAHFAEIDSNNIVIRVIVIDNSDTLDAQGNESESIGSQFCTDLFGGEWIKTSYNNTIRHKYASIGDTYDQTLDVFKLPKPYVSWTYNNSTFNWEAPVARPTVTLDANGVPTEEYIWIEESLSWLKTNA